MASCLRSISLSLCRTGERSTAAAFNVGGQLVASSIQDFVSRLNIPLVSYDQQNCTLTLGFGLSESVPILAQPFSLTQPLGDLAGLSAGGTINVSTVGEFLFKLGIDLRPLGYALGFGPGTLLDDIQGKKNPLASEFRELDAQDKRLLHRQSEQAWRARSAHHAQQWRTFRVDFDQLANKTPAHDPHDVTLGDVRDEILSKVPAELQGLLEIDFDTTLKRLILTDKTQGKLQPFSVEAINDSPLAGSLGLGIAGSSNTVESDGFMRIRGTPIHGDDVRQHVFIAGGNEIPHITSQFTASATGIKGLANIGMIGVGIDQGTLNLKLNLDARLRDPNSDGRITLSEITNGLKKPSIPTVSLKASNLVFRLHQSIVCDCPSMPNSMVFRSSKQVVVPSPASLQLGQNTISYQRSNSMVILLAW